MFRPGLRPGYWKVITIAIATDDEHLQASYNCTPRNIIILHGLHGLDVPENMRTHIHTYIHTQGRLKLFLFQGANSTAAGHYKGFQCSIVSYLVHTVAEPTHYIRWVSNIAHVNMGYHTIFQNWYNIKRLYY